MFICCYKIKFLWQEQILWQYILLWQLLNLVTSIIFLWQNMTGLWTCWIKCPFQGLHFCSSTQTMTWRSRQLWCQIRFEQGVAKTTRPFFHCQIRPLNPDGTMCERADRDIPLQLMFFSRFLKCCLTPDHPLTKTGHQMVYERSPEPVVDVGHIRHALCRVPLMPCFLDGNSTPTIPQSYNRNQARKFKHWQADTRTTIGSKL